MCLSIWPTPPTRQTFWTSARPAIWTRCAAVHGTGSARVRQKNKRTSATDEQGRPNLEISTCWNGAAPLIATDHSRPGCPTAWEGIDRTLRNCRGNRGKHHTTGPETKKTSTATKSQARRIAAKRPFERIISRSKNGEHSYNLLTKSAVCTRSHQTIE